MRYVRLHSLEAVPVSHNHAVWTTQGELLPLAPSNLAIQRLSKG